MTATASTVHFAGHRFDVSVDPDFATVQLSHLAGFVPQAAFAPPCGQRTRVRVRRDELLFTTLMARLASMPSLPTMPFRGEPYRRTRLHDVTWWRPSPGPHLTQDHLYARDTTGQVHVAVRPTTVRGERYPMRAVRELVLRCGENRGWTTFHAAAASVTGAGVLIAGPSRAGKTTVLSALAAHSGADLVASDRAMVCAHAETVVGVPLSVRIAAGTLSALPTPRRSLAPPLLPNVFGTAEKATRTPQRFARGFGIQVHDSAALRAIVLPRLTEDAAELTARHADPRVATTALASVCCTPHDEDWLDPWFTDRTNGTEELRERAARLITHLVTKVPVIQVSAGIHTPSLLPKLADTVLRSLP